MNKFSFYQGQFPGDQNPLVDGSQTVIRVLYKALGTHTAHRHTGNTIPTGMKRNEINEAAVICLRAF